MNCCICKNKERFYVMNLSLFDDKSEKSESLISFMIEKRLICIDCAIELIHDKIQRRYFGIDKI